MFLLNISLDESLAIRDVIYKVQTIIVHGHVEV